MQKPLVWTIVSLCRIDVVKVAASVLAIRRKVGTTAFIRLADAAGAVNEDFAEAAVVRLVLVLVTQMPFAEDAGLVAGLPQQLWKRRRGQRHPLAFLDRVRHAVAELVSSAQDAPIASEHRSG